MAQIAFYLILAFIISEFILSQWLMRLNISTWNQPLPDEVAGIFDPQKYAHAKDYALAHDRIDHISSVISLIITLIFLGVRGFAFLDGIARRISDLPVVQSLVFFGILALGLNVISLPFQIYSTFVIEEKFGFNKMTPALFISDKVKTMILGVLIGGGFIALLTYLFNLLGSHFWMVGWFTVSGFSIFVAAFFATVFVPLFNKLTPLQSGELRESIEKYSTSVKFPLTNIFIMDGSKRSTKANAFFSGLGSRKNIILFDNLVKDLNVDEITAVLAHEVGHYEKKHVLKGIMLSTVQMGVFFFLFQKVATLPFLSEILGASMNSLYLSIVVFYLLASPIFLLIRLLSRILSRKYEYEADAFAAKTNSAGNLISGLKKLSVNHLSNLQPHPTYVFFNYSHPPLLQRMWALTHNTFAS